MEIILYFALDIVKNNKNKFNKPAVVLSQVCLPRICDAVRKHQSIPGPMRMNQM